MERYFFEIPIFRCTTQELHAEHMKYFHKYCPSMTDEDIMSGYKPNYRYREMVGMIRMCTTPAHIKIYIHILNSLKIRKNFSHKKWMSYKECEFSVSVECSNEEIYKLLSKKIQSISKKYKRHYLDLSCYENVAPYINYRRILGYEFDNKMKYVV